MGNTWWYCVIDTAGMLRVSEHKADSDVLGDLLASPYTYQYLGRVEADNAHSAWAKAKERWL